MPHAMTLMDALSPITPDPFAQVHTKLVFVTACMDLGPKHMEKTPAARLMHFKRLAASGISLFIFVSPSNVAAMEDIQTEFPIIVGLRPGKMEDFHRLEDLQTVQNVRMPPTLHG